jgi:hypothetical protein
LCGSSVTRAGIVLEHGAAVGSVHGEVFGDIRPATGFIVVHGFLDPRWLVEVEADAVVGG